MAHPSGQAGAGNARSDATRARRAHDWWPVGLRSLAAFLFGLTILMLPSSTIASLILLFVAYVAADGMLAIVAAARAPRRGAHAWMMMLTGMTNLTVAAAVLIWQAIAVVPVVPMASAWAVVIGALMLAAATRLSGPQGRWFLALAGTMSASWGALVAAAGPSSADDPRIIGFWLSAYALAFGVMLLIAAFWLRRGHPELRDFIPEV